MSDQCRRAILERIRLHGPLTFADFMETALYDPEVGYYATAARRSGRGGDFYTSVDVGPVFGEFLARQFAEMGRLMMDTVDLVEAGAGNGRLSRDVLDTLETIAPDLCERVRLHLVERSAPAREAQAVTLGRHAPKLVSSTGDVPSAIHGILFANELLDALPTHIVVCREEGLREIVIDAAGDRLVERESAPSTPAIDEYVASLDMRVAPGWRAEINLQAIEWVRRAARAIERGFLVLVDYGHEASVLYSASHAQGTLAAFTGHVIESIDERRDAPWLRDPGTCDITAHVDFTSIRNAAIAGGLEPLCLVDQMHFLLGLGVGDWLRERTGPGRRDLTQRLALKTLLVPGGLGTTHHVMMFGRNMGRPVLKGCG